MKQQETTLESPDVNTTRQDIVTHKCAHTHVHNVHTTHMSAHTHTHTPIHTCTSTPTSSHRHRKEANESVQN